MKTYQPNHIAFLFFFLFFLSFAACTSDKKDNVNTSNMVYEMLFDESVKNGVKELDFVGSDLVLAFDCDGNLNKMIFPSEKVEYLYQTQGDSITNQLSEKQKSLYILNKKGKVRESQSLKWNGKEWLVEYTENWSYDALGRPLLKMVNSPNASEKKYFINREQFNYDADGKLEILKYGKDSGSGKTNGLLRTETRKANDYGNWVSIEELDEDNIPFRSSTFDYQYDKQGNWTQIIVHEKNNYTNKNSLDTIQRKISYYNKQDCK